LKRQPAEIVRVHELKTWPRYFRLLIAGKKHTEFRRYDRDFQPGDVLLLREYDPIEKAYTGSLTLRVIRAMYVPPQSPENAVLELADAPPVK
jgi:Domain of unknown function (DUF3850)